MPRLAHKCRLHHSLRLSPPSPSIFRTLSVGKVGPRRVRALPLAQGRGPCCRCAAMHHGRPSPLFSWWGSSVLTKTHKLGQHRRSTRILDSWQRMTSGSQKSFSHSSTNFINVSRLCVLKKDFVTGGGKLSDLLCFAEPGSSVGSAAHGVFRTGHDARPPPAILRVGLRSRFSRRPPRRVGGGRDGAAGDAQRAAPPTRGSERPHRRLEPPLCAGESAVRASGPGKLRRGLRARRIRIGGGGACGAARGGSGEAGGGHVQERKQRRNTAVRIAVGEIRRRRGRRKTAPPHPEIHPVIGSVGPGSQRHVRARRRNAGEQRGRAGAG